MLDEKNPHVQKIRDGTTIKLYVNMGMYTMDMWICTDETGPFFQLAGTVNGQAGFDKSVRPAALCVHEGAGIRRLEKAGETELNGVKERRNRELNEPMENSNTQECVCEKIARQVVYLRLWMRLIRSSKCPLRIVFDSELWSGLL